MVEVAAAAVLVVVLEPVAPEARVAAEVLVFSLCTHSHLRDFLRCMEIW